jgi:hypothetical protein
MGVPGRGRVLEESRFEVITEILFSAHNVKDLPLDKFVQVAQGRPVGDIADDRLQQLAEEDDEKEMAYDSIRQIKENIAYCLDKLTEHDHVLPLAGNISYLHIFQRKCRRSRPAHGSHWK